MQFRQGELVILRAFEPEVICVWAWPDPSNEEVFSVPNETYALYIKPSSRYITTRHCVLIDEKIVSVPWNDLVPA